MKQFEPVFGDTQSYGILRNVADALVVGLQYLDKLFKKMRDKELGGALTPSNINIMDPKSGMEAISKAISHASNVFQEAIQGDTSFDAFTA